MQADSRPGAIGSPAAGERRDDIARRHKTFWPTSLRSPAGTRRAHVLNISRTGAKVHADIPAAAGEKIEIAIGALWRRGVVRWTSGSTFGIAFDEPLSDDVLKRCLTATPPPTPANGS